MKYFNCPEVFKDGESLDQLITGIFFRSDNDNSTNYVVSAKEINKDHNVIMEVYEVGCIQTSDPVISTGDEVATFEDQYSELLVTINCWGKYFFPVYSNDMQLYYDQEVHYRGKYKTDQIISMAEAVNFAIKVGLDLAEIKPY